ncbi:MAG: hypothetical protein ACLVLH_12110 [Eisenbergiella massiliensis]
MERIGKYLKVYADRATGRGLAWLRKKPSQPEMGETGIEKNENRGGSVFYWIEKMQRPGQNASYSPMG